MNVVAESDPGGTGMLFHPHVLLHLFVIFTITVGVENEGFLWNTLRLTKMLLKKCLEESGGTRGDNNVSLFRKCILRRSMVALDRLRTIDHLELCRGIDLVKYRNETDANRQLDRSHGDVREVDWRSQVIGKLDAVLNTHILKIQMKTDDLTVEGRRRRHHQHMLPFILFSTIAVTMIAIPMGFQFLAVLGGKALLLAKLALILTSIQGLKKIATSNLNYGLYHNLPANTWHYDRSWYHNLNDDQQRYQGVDIPDSALDLLRPMSPRN